MESILSALITASVLVSGAVFAQNTEYPTGGAGFDAVVLSVAKDESLRDLDIKVFMSAYPYHLGKRILELTK